MRDKALSEKWRVWTKDHDAAKVFAFADAELLNTPELNSDMLRGARNYKAILMTLADTEDGELTIPGSGLRHDIDPKPRTVKDKTPPKKKA